MRLPTRRFVLSLFAFGICYLWFASLAVAQDPTLPPADSAPPAADNSTPANFNPNLRYRLTNQFLGEGRSLDTHSTGNNDPFMGTTADVSGQFWMITTLDNGFYRLTNQFLGQGRSLDTYGDGDNDPFMGTTADVSGQFWMITTLDNGFYRLTNQFLGQGRSLDTYSTGNNDPFLGTTADVSGQFWKITPYPPFSGTVFIDPDIITSDDPTLFQAATYTGQGMRTMFDRRVDDWITVNAYLFNATFSDGLSAEVQVNPEFGSAEAAQDEADTYAREIGRIPTVLRTDLQTVWIHKGVEVFGGGNNNILIHTGQGANYMASGVIEEVLIHEGAHTSLDADHKATAGWLAAQTADPVFISTYARDNRVVPE